MSDFSKFGVPMPGGIRNGMLQPRLNYKFRVIFKNFGEGNFSRELTQQVEEAERPSFTQSIVKVHAYNSVAYVPGKHEWKEVNITIRDDITNAVQAAVGAQIQRQLNNFEQTSAVSGANVKFGLELHYLDGTNGEETASWVLDGCWVTNSTYSPGKYSDESGYGNVKLTIRYDNATLLRGPGGDGTTVGADPFPNTPSGTGRTSMGF